MPSLTSARPCASGRLPTTPLWQVSQFDLHPDHHLSDRPAETWYEAGEVPGKLRIDIAPLDSMNAFIYLGDSAIVFKGGKRVAAREDRNLLMTLGFDVYGQPPQTTIAQLKAAQVDLSKIREDSWRGTKVWVVGAEKGDTTTNQFW